MYFAQNYEALIIGRIFIGFSTGGAHLSGLLVISEYTSPANRGMFLNLKTTATLFGSGVIHFLGNFMHWRTITLMALIPQVTAFLMALTWPESPAWLATKKRYEKCEEEFYWLRGQDEKAVLEVTELIEQQKKRFSQPGFKMSIVRKILNFLRKFTQKSFLKPFIIGWFGTLLMEASGRHFFPTYALQIMKDLIHTDTLLYYYTMGVDLIVIISNAFSSFLVRVTTRRFLLFSTGISSFVVLSCLSIYLYLVSIDVLAKDRPILMMSLLIAFFFLANLGCSPLPLTFHGELFPLIHREAGTVAISAISSLSLTLVLKMTPYLLKFTQIYGTFAIFGIIMAGTLLILYFILPETKDRTMQEIDNYFTFGKFREDPCDDDYAHLKMISQENHSRNYATSGYRSQIDGYKD